MNEKVEINDSFEENEEDYQKINSRKSDNQEDILKQDKKNQGNIELYTNKEDKLFGDIHLHDRHAKQTNNILWRLIKISTCLGIFVIIEFIGSNASNSVGVLTISAELFNHLIKSIITIISIVIIQNPANEVMTYGYHRSEIISSLCSILIVLVLSIWIVINSIQMIMTPRQINENLMVLFSVLGLCFNLTIRYLKESNPVPDLDEGKFLKNYNEDNLNTPLLEEYLGLEHSDKEITIINKKEKKNIEVKETIHLICDILQSSLTIIASILIYFFQLNHPFIKIIDDICGISFFIIMCIIGYPTTKECIDILMEASPENINAKSLYQELKEVVGVIDVHDIHLWSLSIGIPCISMHLLTNTPQKSLEGAMKICKRYGIIHCTIQVEDNNEGRRLSFMKCEHNDDNGIH